MPDGTEAYDSGFLQVRVSTANDALPVENASVVIAVPSGRENEGYVLYSVLTDQSGLTPVFSLPAPPKEESERPGGRTPYAEYQVRVNAPRFLPQIYEGVPVFSGITTVQPASLEPAPDNVANPEPQIFPPHSSWV